MRLPRLYRAPGATKRGPSPHEPPSSSPAMAWTPYLAEKTYQPTFCVGQLCLACRATGPRSVKSCSTDPQFRSPNHRRCRPRIGHCSMSAYSRAVIDRGGPRRPRRGAARREGQGRRRRHRLRRHRGTRRPGAHQQSRGQRPGLGSPRRKSSRPEPQCRGWRRPPSDRQYRGWAQPHGPGGRGRSRYRPGAGAHRCLGDAAGGDARGFQAAQARPIGDRDRQSARI